MNLNHKIKKRKKALETINELVNNASHLLLIHYSCESFYNVPSGYTPRVTTIAVRYYNTAQTKSFGIHKVAEMKKTPFEDIENNYDELEREMLKEFFQFVKKHKSYTWIHWNMRDLNFGFEAIENRYRVLGGRPETIDDEKKYDLARLLIDIYGVGYIGHPRLEKLIEKNKISHRDFLDGQSEAAAFTNKEYVKLHMSTLKKVDVFHSILDKVASGNLKTNAKWHEPYGLSPQGVYEAIKDHWLYAIITLLLGAIVGAVVSNMMG
ncbi:hypothetical protein [Priestia sp. JSM ZJ58]|uniref:hypothetical protein n=1 Tax=Priestia sp. JSM ZJ58 TaxID=3376189 RepID=UPI003796162C